MTKKIKSIEKGSGEGSSFFCVKDDYRHAILGNFIHEIKEEKKAINWEGGQVCTEILVYHGYSESGELLFEVEADSSLTIIYQS